MKKMIAGLSMLLCLLLCILSVSADTSPAPSALMNELRGLFDSRWDGWIIPHVTHMEEDYYAFDARTDGVNGTAMLILKRNSTNVLCILEQHNGVWKQKTRSLTAIRRGDHIPSIVADEEDSYTLRYHNGPNWSWTLLLNFRQRMDGEWHIDYAATLDQGEDSMEIFVGEDYLHYRRYAGDQYEKRVYGVYESSFEHFELHSFPLTIAEAQEALTLPPSIPTSRTSQINLPQPREIEFEKGRQHPVYSAPGEDSYRAANGKATMSTNDWVQVFGEDQGWLLVQYDISSDQMRFGYIAADALPRDTYVRELYFAYTPCLITRATYLTDDPLNSAVTLCHLSAGNEVSLLATMGSWAYVETQMPNGATVRGFIPNGMDTLQELSYTDDTGLPRG